MTINKKSKWFKWLERNYQDEKAVLVHWIRGICGQLEEGKTGNLHWQIYLECNSRIDFNKLRKFFTGCHIEKRHGSAQDAMVYCQKDDETFRGCRFKYGAFFIGGKGARTDLTEIKEKLKVQPLEQVADDHFEAFVRYHSGFEKFSNWYQPKREDIMPEVYFLIGPPGTGKSTLAKNLAGCWGVDAYWQSGGKWWFGYRGEPYVIVDEFEGQWPYAFWKRVCDRGAFTIEGKGTERQLLATRFVFTSNKSWTEWWQIPPHRFEEIKRRVTGIIAVTDLQHFREEPHLITWKQKRKVEHGHDCPYPLTGEGYFWE